MLITAQQLLVEAEEKGITDESICRAVDVHPTTLWRWRKGNNPRFDQLRKLIGLVKGAEGD
ncbi:helix-turn-helix domain-containing protein [Limnoglobus roseus]|uniref:helix-turn-helix domain-containing protein n=1 Tax=Limnoglobus roseus TaxID=2598579 RepID=UPI0036F1A4DC